MTTLVNLTPHDVTITVDGRTEVIKPTGLARCQEKSVQVGMINGWIPVYETEYGEVSGLPAPAEDTLFIVSVIVAKAKEVQSRNDIYVPAKTLRDENGVIIGCIGLNKV